MATESFFSNASLAYLASAGAGKDGKTYSIKPTDGSGDFTFSRGSNLAATRVGPTGLIEKGRENLLLQSNQFDTTPWLLNTTSATSGQSGYDGTNDAWLLNSTGTGFPRAEQSVSTSGVFVFSVYAKAATDGFMQMRTNGASSQVWFDLSDGSIVNEAGAQHISSSTEDVGNGWYRYSVLVNGSLTSVRIYPGGAYGVYSTSGNGIYIQDAQVEIGLAATEVITTGATTGKAGLLEDEPRFDYSGGATCPSLLLEPSRTNLFGQSEYFGSGFWVKNDLNISIGFTSPDGLTNASKLAATTSNSVHKMRASTIVTPAVGTTVTFSIYCKPQEIAKIALVDNWTNLTYSVVNLSTNSVIEEVFYTGTGSTAITEMANGFKRISFTYQTASINTQPSVYLLDDSYTSGNPTSYTFASDGSSGVIAYGAQLEQGSYPTSYIPNHSGGSVTRGADECTGAGDATTFNANEGVFYAEISTNSDDTDKAISLNNGVVGATNNRLWMGYSTTGKRVYALGYVNNSIQFVLSKLMTDESLFVKIACKYAENDVAFFVNGEKVGTDTSALAFTELTSMDFNIGLGGASSGIFYGNAKQVLVFNEALSDADCIALTTL